MTRRASVHALVAVIGMALTIASTARAEKVARVIDGDTIVLTNGTTIRYIGVDSPESHDPTKPVEFMSAEATEHNRRLVEGRDVHLKYDMQRLDKHGRTLAYVYVDTLFVNADMVRSGCARVLTISPDVRYASYFLACQQQAREAGRDVWSQSAAHAFVSTQPVIDTAKYYITKSGSKYHRGGCKYLSKSAIEITRNDAITRGYDACSSCMGGSVPSASATGTNAYTAPVSSSLGRCQAITKKGTQCKRNAKAGSKYCWQHGG
jgi:micrococcal nuclease